jgi:Leucine-rich repeat (LRR) protein
MNKFGSVMPTKLIMFMKLFILHFPQLQILNLGNNEFEELPEALEYLTMLEKLHLFNNHLKTLSPKVLSMNH